MEILATLLCIKFQGLSQQETSAGHHQHHGGEGQRRKDQGDVSSG